MAVATLDFPNIQPGYISAILFIFLDIITVGILDIVLARVVCLAYYRNINEGKPVSVKSADIPGLSNYLLGRSLSWINIVAIATKLALLAVVLTANISIDSKEAITRSVTRDATFALSPSDEHINMNYTYTVRRRLESSKSCFEEGDNDNSLTYYSLRFDLVDDVKLPNDYGTPPLNTTGQYDVNDSTVLCMSPALVSQPIELIKVTGCSRIEGTNNSCLTVVSREQRIPVPDAPESDTEIYNGSIVHRYIDYSQEDVDSMFNQYNNVTFTCLSTEIGISSESDSSTYTHCLMVSYDNAKKETVVERWIRGPSDDGISEDMFILEYPGIIFEGYFAIGRLASARYLELPFPFTDYRTLSGELVAQASDYKALWGTSESRFGELEYKDGRTVTTITIYAVALVVGSVVIVLVALFVTVLLLQKDTRPRFNTINGLSSIVREEHVPSGRSYAAGESAILGLKFTQDDRMHFGPLRSYDEGTAYQEGYDIS